MAIRQKLRILSKGYSLENDWPWNPYKGWTVQAVIDQNLSYVTWALEKGLQLDNDAFAYYQNQVDE